MARQKGSANLAGTIEVLAGGPIDARSVVPALADLTVASNFPYPYVGMETYVVAENKKYRLIDEDVTDSDSWEEAGSGSSVPEGGTTGQVLAKHSDDDGDAEWRDETQEIEEISSDDFDELSQAEKDNGKAYFIPDRNMSSGFTVMGNRFDKANIYTETERMVGSWMGKPLYQKTIDFGACPNATTKEVSLNIANIEKIIYYNGFMLSSDNATTIPLPNVADSTYQVILVINRSYIRITTGVDRSSFNGYITIQYTKTTDGTVNIGTGNDYSTDEQIIGTWIDEKPIYQKTIDCEALPNNTTKSVNTNILNASKLINYSATAFGTNNNGIMTIPRLWLGGTGDVYIGFNADLTVINLATTSDRSNMNAYCTLQYTKTTD